MTPSSPTVERIETERARADAAIRRALDAHVGTSEGVLLVSLMYNGTRPWAARQAQWKLFRELGADGVVIPTDSVPAPPVQMGGDADSSATASAGTAAGIVVTD